MKGKARRTVMSKDNCKVDLSINFEPTEETTIDVKRLDSGAHVLLLRMSLIFTGNQQTIISLILRGKLVVYKKCCIAFETNIM